MRNVDVIRHRGCDAPHHRLHHHIHVPVPNWSCACYLHCHRELHRCNADMGSDFQRLHPARLHRHHQAMHCLRQDSSPGYHHRAMRLRGHRWCPGLSAYGYPDRLEPKWRQWQWLATERRQRQWISSKRWKRQRFSTKRWLWLWLATKRW